MYSAHARASPVAPADALQLSDAARSPKTSPYFGGGHDPFAQGPGNMKVTIGATLFLIDSLNLPATIR